MLGFKSLTDSALAACSMGVTLLFARAACGVSLHLPHPGLFLGTLVLLSLSLASLGLVIGSAFVLSRAASRLVELFNYPVYILCGLLFPLDLVPAWARPLGYLLSPTWAMRALELSLSAGSVGPAAGPLLAVAALGGLYFVVARRLYAAVLVRVRETGTLGVY
ncbi:MAG: ABC transporter permease [Acetobacteraceae bacterium]|nr:ABC transporter permease [Acetobacteraceae bacterium]